MRFILYIKMSWQTTGYRNLYNMSTSGIQPTLIMILAKVYSEKDTFGRMV